MYYLLFASVLRKHISDIVLMTILSVPSALALLPTIFVLGKSEREEQITMLENTTATKSYHSVAETNSS